MLSNGQVCREDIPIIFERRSHKKRFKKKDISLYFSPVFRFNIIICVLTKKHACFRLESQFLRRYLLNLARGFSTCGWKSNTHQKKKDERVFKRRRKTNMFSKGYFRKYCCTDGCSSSCYETFAPLGDETDAFSSSSFANIC